MLSSLLSAILLSAIAHSSPLHKRANASDPWFLARFSSLVAFGDSYTDENRLNYFISNNGSAPPAGTVLPETFHAPSGGRTWPRYVVQYTGSEVNDQFVPRINLYDYAVSGAVCSNEITPRIFSPIHADFPSVVDYEVPAFINDTTALNSATGKPTFTPALTGSSAVYVIWIGTNDLGAGAFLTDSQVAGKTLTDYTNCIFDAFDSLYASGGRYFVLNNVIPLNLAPLYANDTSGGVDASQDGPDTPDNRTAIAERMKEYVTTVNNVFRYQLPYEVALANRYPGANFALFDVYRLVLDVYSNPTAYLNGTAPANVTSFQHHCNANGSVCTDVAPDSPDSFLWYDALHPSEQLDRIIAGHFVDVLSGNSSYATYY